MLHCLVQLGYMLINWHVTQNNASSWLKHGYSAIMVILLSNTGTCDQVDEKTLLAVTWCALFWQSSAVENLYNGQAIRHT